jgi:predicted kinase
MDKDKITKEALVYLKSKKELLFQKYLDGHVKVEPQMAFFTAGPSGAGKTEFAQELLEIERELVHLDIDSVRDFFIPIGYNGTNSDIFQLPANRAVQALFDEIVKRRGLSLVLDSNLSHLQTATENMVKLLKNNYKIEVFYIYDKLEDCFLYTKLREKVTKRSVPEEVFFNSVIKSRITTYEIKKLFSEHIILNVIDKRDKKRYENISYDDFYTIIPEL